MKKLTKEDYSYLSKFEDRFRSINRDNYMIAIPTSDAEKIRKIYSNILGFDYKASIYCGKCVMDLLKRVSVHYYKYEKENECKSDNKTERDSQNDFEGKVKKTNRRSNSKKV